MKTATIKAHAMRYCVKILQVQLTLLTKLLTEVKECLKEGRLKDLTLKMVEVINRCLEKNLSHPVEIMKYLQSQLVQGRALDVSDVSNVDDSLTNFIMVDRAKLIKNGLEELKALENKFITLEVQFCDEVCKVFLTYIKLLLTQYLG